MMSSRFAASLLSTQLDEEDDIPDQSDDEMLSDGDEEYTPPTRERAGGDDDEEEEYDRGDQPDVRDETEEEIVPTTSAKASVTSKGKKKDERFVKTKQWFPHN